MSRPLNLRYNLSYALKESLGKKILIKIRVFQGYLEGTLVSFDQYSNIVLKDAAEIEKSEEKGSETRATYEELFVRGDAIVNIAILEE